MEPFCQSLSPIAESTPTRNNFLISFGENMYQFCFLLIRFDVCHHHSPDLWLLSKEMVWWASVFWWQPATGRQKVANSLFSFMQVASDGANKCLSRCMRQGSRATPQCQDSRGLGSPPLAPATPRLLAWDAEGESHCTRGVSPERLPCHPQDCRASEPRPLLLKALLFTGIYIRPCCDSFIHYQGSEGGLPVTSGMA